MLKTVIDQAFEYDLDIISFKNKIAYDSSLTVSENEDEDPPVLEVKDGMTYIADYKYKNEAWWYVAKREFILSTGLKFVEGKWMEDSVYTTSLFMAAERTAHLPFDVHRYVKVPNSILSNKEPKHYIEVIYDIESVIMEFAHLIAKAEQYPDQQRCVNRLRTRQQSFVFFVIIRVIRSQLSFKELWEMLMRIKKVGGYPLNHFLGEEYNRPIYKVLTPLFNNKSSLKLLFKSFRLIKK